MWLCRELELWGRNLQSLRSRAQPSIFLTWRTLRVVLVPAFCISFPSTYELIKGREKPAVLFDFVTVVRLHLKLVLLLFSFRYFEYCHSFWIKYFESSIALMVFLVEPWMGITELMFTHWCWCGLSISNCGCLEWHRCIRLLGCFIKENRCQRAKKPDLCNSTNRTSEEKNKSVHLTQGADFGGNLWAGPVSGTCFPARTN